jgi:hypothetical protein
MALQRRGNDVLSERSACNKLSRASNRMLKISEGKISEGDTYLETELLEGSAVGQAPLS